MLEHELVLNFVRNRKILYECGLFSESDTKFIMDTIMNHPLFFISVDEGVDTGIRFANCFEPDGKTFALPYDRYTLV